MASPIHNRLDAYLDRENLEAVWFAGPNAFAWLTDGGDNVVDRFDSNSSKNSATKPQLGTETGTLDGDDPRA